MEAFEYKKTTANPCLGRLNTSLFLVTKIAILAKCHLLVNVLYTFIHFDVNVKKRQIKNAPPCLCKLKNKFGVVHNLRRRFILFQLVGF